MMKLTAALLASTYLAVMTPVGLFKPTAAPAASISQVANVSSTASQTTYTFSGTAIGAAGARKLIIGVICTHSATGFSITGCTVDAVAANLCITSDLVASRTDTAIYIIDKPTGTTASIAITVSTALTGQCAVVVWAAYNLPSLQAHCVAQSRSSTSQNLVLNLDIPANGVAVGVSGSPNGSGTTTWTGLTERIDTTTAQGCYNGADLTSATLQANLTIGSDLSGTDDAAGCSASFGSTGFPHVANQTQGNTTNNTTSIAVPTGNVGDMLLAIVGTDASSATTYPAGWTKIGEIFSGSDGLAAAWRIADGTEGATISVTSGANWYWTILRITGNHATAAAEAGVGVSASSANNVDPPSLTPSWGALNTLWIAAGHHDSSGALSSYPACYGLGPTNQINTGALFVGCRKLNAASEDPAIIQWIGTAGGKANTFAIRPA